MDNITGFDWAIISATAFAFALVLEFVYHTIETRRLHRIINDLHEALTAGVLENLRLNDLLVQANTRVAQLSHPNIGADFERHFQAYADNWVNQ